MIKTLLSVRLRSVVAGLTGAKAKDGSRKVSKARLVVLTVAYLYIIAVFGGMFTFFALSMAPILIPLGLDWFYFAAFIAISFCAVFILSIFETKSELFECKDNDLLLSMPIKPRDIVLSRIFTVLIYNYLETLLFMLPAVICYAVFGGGAMGIFGSVIVVLLLPLLSTALSSGVGYLVALISKKFKKNSFFTLIVSLAFLALYFWGYSAIMGSVGEGDTPDFVALSENLSAFRFIGESALLHPLFTPLFVLLSAASAFVAYYLISRSYVSIVTAGDGGKKIEYKARSYKKGTAFIALVKKEFKTFISSATYMLNSAMGTILTVVIAGVIVVNKDKISVIINMLSSAFDGFDAVGAASALLCAMLVLVSSVNMISSSALSLEGKHFWIIRSMPVSARDILLSKTVPAMTIPVIPNLVSSVLMIVTVGTDPLHSAFLILIPQAAGVFSALLGILINAVFPKLEFENEAQVVKQSMATVITMLATTLFGLINLAIAFVFSVILESSLLAMTVMLLVSIAFSVVAFFVITKPLSKKIEKMSV